MKKITTKKKVVKKGITLNTKRTVKIIDKIVNDAKTTLSPYTASIKIFGRTYTSTGATVKEAIENMKTVGKVGGVCVMTVSKGDVKREKILNAGQLFRLFSASRVLHEIAIKNVCSMFSNI